MLTILTGCANHHGLAMSSEMMVKSRIVLPDLVSKHTPELYPLCPSLATPSLLTTFSHWQPAVCLRCQSARQQWNRDALQETLQEPLNVWEMHPLPQCREPLLTSFCGGRARILEFYIPISHKSFRHMCSGWSYKIRHTLKRNGVGINSGLVSGGIYSAPCFISSSALS